MRKVLATCALLCTLCSFIGWRQSDFNIKKLKKLYRVIQKLRNSTSKDENKRLAKAESIRDSYQDYLNLSEEYLKRAKKTYDQCLCSFKAPQALVEQLESYMKHAERQIDQIRRRVLEGEKIPHDEKIFSIFEPYTEWISKGKAGVPVELGLRVCVVEDKHGFILHHKVMENETDDKVAIEMVKGTIERFKNFKMCSFDKGFHSPDNQRDLEEILLTVVMPKKGRLSAEDKLREYSDEFIQAKRKHSAVESAINALQVHGLNKCLDHGIDGFKRYVAVAVVARNIHKLGSIILKQERNRERLGIRKAA